MNWWIGNPANIFQYVEHGFNTPLPLDEPGLLVFQGFLICRENNFGANSHLLCNATSKERPLPTHQDFSPVQQNLNGYATIWHRNNAAFFVRRTAAMEKREGTGAQLGLVNPPAGETLGVSEPINASQNASTAPRTNCPQSLLMDALFSCAKCGNFSK